MALSENARARARAPVVETPDRADSPSVAHRIRDHASALSNALMLVRLAAGSDPRLLNALDIADRQAKALVALADELHGPA
jgi:hypothetical protein